MTLDKAIRIMAAGFEGKYDRGGQPYALHCLRVMMAMDTEVEKIVAVLHDVPEDGVMSIEELRKEGFMDNVLNPLQLLDHSDKTVPYQHYIRRLSHHPIAVKVKKADLMDNSNLMRIKGLTKKDFDRVMDYHIAYTYLSQINF
jgi:(p)ppGpp synthase/HD superfamily hydrolase